MRNSYRTDLSDTDWELIKDLVEKLKSGPRAKYSRREILNAIFYVTRTGCQWRNLPHDFPPWQTVYGNFRNLETRGVFEEINTILRDRIREKIGRKKEPTGAIVDSQSVKTTEKGGFVGVLTVPKRSTAVRDIYSLIRKVCCYKQR